MNFEGMPKIARLNKPVIVTEKIDGTNAQINVEVLSAMEVEIQIDATMLLLAVQPNGDHWVLRAGSKNRFLTVENDNFGFAKWAYDNGDELLCLGPGVHRGEWWGQGIQRGYGLDHRRFSLFNIKHPMERLPECCHIVPVLGTGVGFEGLTEGLEMLKANGSMAAPGFMKPEGLVAFHTGNGAMFKATIDNEIGKWSK